MNSNYTLDTNILIALLGGDAEIRGHITKRGPAALSSVVLGELYFGAIQSSKREANLVKLDELKAECSILGVDGDTAVVWGRLKAELRANGCPIPDNDLWIAALAVQHGLTLITRDAHFNVVAGLSLEKW